MNNFYKKKQINIISKFAIDLTNLSKKKKLEAIFEIEKEIFHVIRILQKKTKNNIILTGDKGVGKTSIIKGLSQKIIKKEVPKKLKKYRIFILDIFSIINILEYKGIKYLNYILLEIYKINYPIIFFIDNFNKLIELNLFNKFISINNYLFQKKIKKNFRFILETTTDKYQKYTDQYSNLEKNFQKIFIPEISVKNCIKILNHLKNSYESYYNVKITNKAIITSSILSNNYINNKRLPDKAINIIEEASSLINIDLHYKKNNIDKFKNTNKFSNYVTEKEVIKILSEKTGISAENIVENNYEKFIRIEKDLKKRMIGQDKAVFKILNVVKRNFLGLSNKNKPIGSFLFLGPNGVGKTKICKILSDIIFNKNTDLIYIDMSEFNDKVYSFDVLQYNKNNLEYRFNTCLIKLVEKNPNSLILINEIEKSHIDFFKILLRLLKYGELIDSFGRKINFKNTIIVMNSNIGLDIFQKNYNSSRNISYAKKTVIDMVYHYFNFNLINEIDDIVFFKPLDNISLEKIIYKNINLFKNKLEKKGYLFEITSSVISYIRKLGFNPSYGANNFKKIIEKKIINPISDEIMCKNFNIGHNIFVDIKFNKIEIK